MKVVIALNGGPYSEVIADSVCNRHWPVDTQFKVLSVIEPVEELTEETSEVLRFAVGKARTKAAEDKCKQFCKRLEEFVPTCSAHFEIRTGKARSEIIQCATEWAADKIMIGARGKDFSPNNFIGSVSRSVCLHSPCSVELVRPRTTHKNGSKDRKALDLEQSGV